MKYVPIIYCFRGTRWCNWLKHCTTSRKVAVSIPDGVIIIFHWHNPSGRSVSLGSTQSVTKMSNRNISWGLKAAGVYGWQPYHFYVPIVLKSGSLNLFKLSGPVQACNGIDLLYLLSSDFGMKSTCCIFLLCTDNSWTIDGLK
jgi:hypothetical protein